MATVDQVIAVLKSEREHLFEECIEDIRDIDLMIKSGGERAKRKASKKYAERLQVINYALNFLENGREELCPD